MNEKEPLQSEQRSMGPFRQVFRKTADGEEGPLDFLAIKAGDTFRMEPPVECPEDRLCPKGWMIAKSDGYLTDGIQGIVIENEPQFIDQDGRLDFGNHEP